MPEVLQRSVKAYLPPAYVVRREGNVLTRVCSSICLSTGGGLPRPGPDGAGYPSQVQMGGGGGLSSQVWTGGYPGQVQMGSTLVRFRLGVPWPGLDRGYPSQVQIGGLPQPGLDGGVLQVGPDGCTPASSGWGVPIPGLDGGYPGKEWGTIYQEWGTHCLDLGWGTSLSRPGWGTPIWTWSGYPPSGPAWGTPHRIWIWDGVPPLGQQKEYSLCGVVCLLRSRRRTILFHCTLVSFKISREKQEYLSSSGSCALLQQAFVKHGYFC